MRQQLFRQSPLCLHPRARLLKTSLALALSAAVTVTLGACQPQPSQPQQTREATVQDTQTMPTDQKLQGKIFVYQAFTRLFGNSNATNQPWGTAAQNGVGKFNDINDAALSSLKAMGVTHLWLTGVPHHALVADYKAYGISDDDPDVVKGRAGSPYAVKDYYSVNPDLAVDPAKRLEEFKALLARAHQHGLKVVIDIVPNHVARRYESVSKPDGVRDFGQDDDVSLEYSKHNNFYYVPGQAFEVPEAPAGYQPLGGEKHPLLDGKFTEMPAKWTGNGARKAKPDFNDWFETVKINYGVKPDGSYDFPRLPADYADKSYADVAAFWQGVDVPNSWLKFRDITQYWLAMGVDGFRFDMAEMVPVEFWSYLNSHIKLKNPDAVLIAEVYQPPLYRDYIKLGKMDYLYDKVGFYDALKPLMQGHGSATALLGKQAEIADISQHMLKFLENHDEQRIASPEFAGDAKRGLPAMVVSALISDSPTLLYFGQEVGEAGALDAGFGKPSRTSIFDYVGVPAHQNWLNGGKFDGALLTPAQTQLRTAYVRLMQLHAQSPALRGSYQPLNAALAGVAGFNDQQVVFVRQSDSEQLLVVANLSDKPVSYQVALDAPVWAKSAKPLTEWFAGTELPADLRAVDVSLPAWGYQVYRQQR